MVMSILGANLPLHSRTHDSWAVAVLGDPLALLNDHAHLEKKAAVNALELIDRWPEPAPPAYWVEKMAAIARDEADHLMVVTRLLTRRGGVMSKFHRNPYAAELRRLVRGGTPGELMDRLMVSALIEARSCERFECLARNCEDKELARLYADLWASENGHYLTFIDLARKLTRDDKEVDRRWEEFLDAEARIIGSQSPGPGMHSGVTASSERIV